MDVSGALSPPIELASGEVSEVQWDVVASGGTKKKRRISGAEIPTLQALSLQAMADVVGGEPEMLQAIASGDIATVWALLAEDSDSTVRSRAVSALSITLSFGAEGIVAGVSTAAAAAVGEKLCAALWPANRSSLMWSTAMALALASCRNANKIIAAAVAKGRLGDMPRQIFSISMKLDQLAEETEWWWLDSFDTLTERKERTARGREVAKTLTEAIMPVYDRAYTRTLSAALESAKRGASPFNSACGAFALPTSDSGGDESSSSSGEETGSCISLYASSADEDKELSWVDDSSEATDDLQQRDGVCASPPGDNPDEPVRVVPEDRVLQSPRAKPKPQMQRPAQRQRRSRCGGLMSCASRKH